MRKFACLFLFITIYYQIARSQDTVSFYFGAHEDDWQLFMNPNAYHDVHRPSTKVVFMDKGKIVEEGTPTEIFNQSSNERTREFLNQFYTRKN